MTNFIISTVAMVTFLFPPVCSKNPLSCVYHEGREFSCTHSGQPLVSCCMCHYFTDGPPECMDMEKNCTEKVNCTETVKGLYGNNTGIAVIVNKSLCDKYILKTLVKPGPVQDLKRSVINSSHVNLTWIKPNDYNNKDQGYTYRVVIITDQGTENVTLPSTYQTYVTHLQQLPTFWTNASVTVSGKMDIGGFYGASTTIYFQREAESSVAISSRENESSAPLYLVFILGVGACVVLVSIMYIYRRRKQICSRITISLPRQLEDASHFSHGSLLQTSQPESIPLKSKSRDATPPDSGHCSMETGTPQQTLPGQGAGASEQIGHTCPREDNSEQDAPNRLSASRWVPETVISGNNLCDSSVEPYGDSRIVRFQDNSTVSADSGHGRQDNSMSSYGVVDMDSRGVSDYEVYEVSVGLDSEDDSGSSDSGTGPCGDTCTNRFISDSRNEGSAASYSRVHASDHSIDTLNNSSISLTLSLLSAASTSSLASTASASNMSSESDDERSIASYTGVTLH